MGTRVAATAVAFLCMVVATSSEWVDYPSDIRCCSNIPVDACDPGNQIQNAACRDVCHYGGCRKGGQCEELGFGVVRFCHCNC